MTGPYRIITRSDLDGIVCAALLKDLGLAGEIKFAHPRDVQDGTLPVTENDIITNLAYSEKAHLVLTHHSSELTRTGPRANLVIDDTAPSAAHVVYRHFGGTERFPHFPRGLLEAADRMDSARLSKADILNPDDWTLLGYLMDNRTGLGRFRNFRISNYQLMMDLVDILRSYGDIREILAHPDVAERVALYRAHASLARAQILRLARIDGALVTIDLRNEAQIFVTNRFMAYALFPQCNVSMHIMPGRLGANTVFALGKSVLNRTCALDIGRLMLEHGGGGHQSVGGCQVENAAADPLKAALIKRIAAGG